MPSTMPVGLRMQSEVVASTEGLTEHCVHREERGITFGRGTGRVEGPRGLNRPWRSRNLTAEKMFYEARGKDIGKGLEGVCLSPLGLL